MSRVQAGLAGERVNVVTEPGSLVVTEPGLLVVLPLINDKQTICQI